MYDNYSVFQLKELLICRVRCRLHFSYTKLASALCALTSRLGTQKVMREIEMPMRPIYSHVQASLEDNHLIYQERFLIMSMLIFHICLFIH